jgi:hypothetical protein
MITQLRGIKNSFFLGVKTAAKPESLTFIDALRLVSIKDTTIYRKALALGVKVGKSLYL